MLHRSRRDDVTATRKALASCQFSLNLSHEALVASELPILDQSQRPAVCLVLLRQSTSSFCLFMILDMVF